MKSKEKYSEDTNGKENSTSDVSIDKYDKNNSNNSRVNEYSLSVHNTGDWFDWLRVSKFDYVKTACVPGINNIPITRESLRKYLSNLNLSSKILSLTAHKVQT